MKSLCWVLIAAAVAAFTVGAVLAFSGRTYGITPPGYWRGSVGFLLFAIALRMMDERR